MLSHSIAWFAVCCYIWKYTALKAQPLQYLASLAVTYIE
jgi:hypothetical protein